VRSAPIPPADYDGEHLNTDEKLEAAGWAAGLRVWEQVGKAYGNYLGDDILANAQLWSLRQAIREEYQAESAVDAVREFDRLKRMHLTHGESQAALIWLVDQAPTALAGALDRISEIRAGG
jgi:hypothetical protein